MGADGWRWSVSNPVQEKSVPRYDSILKVVARLYWIAFGNFPLFFLPILIVQNKAYGPSLYDLFFWLAWLALVLVRYADIVRLNGKTADYEPATLSHWKRYAFKLTALSIAAGVSAHVLAFVL
ncbi:MAG: hypothetical protein C4523_06625 [Myxococcales bacterium]|nr:MAG: hypothetical protein C4523_06625 [Myxococcales bacterium]